MVEHLARSLRRDVERVIAVAEGVWTLSVTADFREGYEQRSGNDQIRWCMAWLEMYRKFRGSHANRDRG